MRKFILLLFIGTFSLLNLTPSYSAESLKPVLDCATSDSSFCIQSISLVFPDGTRVLGKLNGKVSPETRTYAPESNLIANWQHYSFQGITFDGGDVTDMYPRIFYFPTGNRNCFANPCVTGADYLETTLTPGNRSDNALNPQKLMPPTSEACVGKAYYPGTPVPTMFNTDASFEITLKLPRKVMQTLGSGGLGRGISNVEMNFEEVDSDSSLVKLLLHPSTYSGYGCNGPVFAPQGDFEGDQITYWIWGLDDIRMQSFGHCESIKSVSVVSNAFWDSFPSWNPITRSIDVNLSGPHLKSDGSLNNVNFQAKITPALAKCLWGIDLTSQNKAQISLTYSESGQENTQLYAGEMRGDQYVLNVSGIHLSAPTLSFKFSEPTILSNSTSVASPSTSPIQSESTMVKSPTQKTPPKLKSLICSKGKLVKVVKAVRPHCPAGYVGKP